MNAIPKAVATALNPPNLSPEAILVRDALIEAGLETPMVPTDLTRDEKYLKIKGAMGEIMDALGLDQSDDSLAETPHRVAKMYVDEIFGGLDYSRFPKITAIENSMQCHEMVKVSEIELVSTCEHHFITIDGFARVAYVPNSRIIGLSKINRLVRFFAQRPQVQERLTRQALVALQALLETEDVAVSISARHYCVKARGVTDSSSMTDTIAVGGAFQADRELRREFLAS